MPSDTPLPPAPTPRAQADVRRALRVATWTDARFLDPIAGLVLPGIGDVLGAAAGLYIVALAARHNVPRPVLARMLANVALDCVVGVVPIVGDLFDLVNRSNLRNARLMERHVLAPTGTRAAGGRWALAAAVVGIAAAVALALAAAVYGVRRLTR